MNYNQNDSIYASIMLGFSKKYTLKSSGCYVFSVAHLLGIDPIECHDKLKSVNAFYADETGDVCLLNHAKIVNAFPNQVASVAKYDSYDNDACLEAIAQNGGCIVKVQNGSYTHFVEFLGNKLLFDSLGGKEKPTSTYTNLLGLRVLVIKKNQESNIYEGLDLTNYDSMKACIDVWKKLQDGKLISQEDHNQIIKESQTKMLEMAQKYEEEKRLLTENIKVLEDLHKQDLSWADMADVYQKKIKAIIDLFASVGIQLSVESDVILLVSTVHDYIANAETNGAFVTRVLSDTSLGSPEAVVEALQQAKLNETTIIELEKQITKLDTTITELKNKQPSLLQFIINKYFK